MYGKCLLTLSTHSCCGGASQEAGLPLGRLPGGWREQAPDCVCQMPELPDTLLVTGRYLLWQFLYYDFH